jgi:hypothetical protein
MHNPSRKYGNLMTIAVVSDADREIPQALRYKVFGMGRKGFAGGEPNRITKGSKDFLMAVSLLP